MADQNNDPTRRITPRPGEDVEYRPLTPKDDQGSGTSAPWPPDVADDRRLQPTEEDVLYETHTHHEGDIHGASVHRRGESADLEAEAGSDDRSERLGDVLGLSDASPDVQIPKPADPGSGHAPGLDVRTPASGTGELSRSKGATGIDMGSGGTGADVDPKGTRRGSGA